METTFLNTSCIGEQVPLGLLLDHLGHRPAKINGNEHLYYNVMKSADSRSTFVVNEHLNIWYDRLTSKSGNVIDFCMAYWPELDPVEVSEKLEQIAKLLKNSLKIPPTKNGRRKRLAIKVPFYHIEETRPVGCNTEITDYLHLQGIWEISIGHLKEVYYYVIDEKGKRKDFFAAGWQNENGGWEVRGRNFSGCLGKKGMTFIPGSEKSLVLFEEYLDYLYWKYANRQPGPSILVLNSPEFLDAGKKRAARFGDVAVYLGKKYLDEEILSAIEKSDPQKIVLVP
jgi:hypothetical protein